MEWLKGIFSKLTRFFDAWFASIKINSPETNTNIENASITVVYEGLQDACRMAFEVQDSRSGSNNVHDELLALTYIVEDLKAHITHLATDAGCEDYLNSVIKNEVEPLHRRTRK